MTPNAQSPRRVPKFDADAGQLEMNRLQNSFYHRVFLPALLAGAPVDVQEQFGYAAVLTNHLLVERRTNPVQATQTLDALIRAYGLSDLPYSARLDAAHFYFHQGDFASGYAALEPHASLSHYLTLAAHLGHPRLTAWQVIRWAEGGITPKGFEHLEGVLQALQARLDGFHRLHGVSIVEDFWERATADNPVDEVAADIGDEIVQRLSSQEVKEILVEARARDASDAAVAFQGQPGQQGGINWPRPWVQWSFHFALLFARLRILVREAENTARDDAGIPRIGEGWVSEMILLHQVRAALPEEKVVHQARPGWLAPQSLDIYLPDYNIAIEYQGTQHSRPLEYFGGAEAFELQQERDARKLDLCSENGCVLIEVHPGYRLQHVVAQVKVAIEQVASRHP